MIRLLAVLWCLSATSAFAQPSVVQSATQRATGATTVTAAFGVGVTSGNHVACLVALNSETRTLTSIAPTAGSMSTAFEYTAAIDHTGATNRRVYLGIGIASTGTQNYTATQSATGELDIICKEVSGLNATLGAALASIIDASTTAANGSKTTVTDHTITGGILPTECNTLLFTGISSTSTIGFSDLSGWTMVTPTTQADGASQVAATVTTYTIPWMSAGGSQSALAVAFALKSTNGSCGAASGGKRRTTLGVG